MDSWGCVVVIVMIKGYAAGKGKKLVGGGVYCWQGQEITLLKTCRPKLGHAQSHISWVEVLCLGLKRLQDAADLLPPIMSMLRMGGSVPLNPYTSLWR